jgi:hypothetical protein
MRMRTMALAASGLRSSAMATANTVHGIPRCVKRRCSLQNPAREPYSYMLSMFMLRPPTTGAWCRVLLTVRIE